MGYLKEILTGDYPSYNEDRLSQVFSASFNNSVLFKKVFLSHIKIQYKSLSDYYSKTQINFGTLNGEARIDIVIFKKKKPVIIIENKVNAPLKMKQLNKYNSIEELKGCLKLAIVKHYFEDFTQNTYWKILHWSDLFQIFKTRLEKGISNQIDAYIVTNFMEHLELMKMSRINKISNIDLTNFADTINAIRTEGMPSISLTSKNIFETGTQILSMLEEIINLTRQESLLLKKIGKNFRYSPRLDYWYQDELLDNNNLMISANITISNSTNNVKFIGTGFFFYNNRPKKWDLMTYAQSTPSGDFIHESYYQKKNVILEDYAKQVIDSWKKWLKSG